jgi:hypothetical protein
MSLMRPLLKLKSRQIAIAAIAVSFVAAVTYYAICGMSPDLMPIFQLLLIILISQF